MEEQQMQILNENDGLNGISHYEQLKDMALERVSD